MEEASLIGNWVYNPKTLTKSKGEEDLYCIAYCLSCQTPEVFKFEDLHNEVPCFTCQERRRLEIVLPCTPEVKNKLRKLRKSSRSRLKLTDEYLYSLWDKQQGRCALTGRPLTIFKGVGQVATNVSIDRIIPGNSGGEYVEGNVRLVCSVVNSFRGSLLDEDFISMCAAVLQKAKTKY